MRPVSLCGGSAPPPFYVTAQASCWARGGVATSSSPVSSGSVGVSPTGARSSNRLAVRGCSGVCAWSGVDSAIIADTEGSNTGPTAASPVIGDWYGAADVATGAAGAGTGETSGTASGVTTTRSIAASSAETTTVSTSMGVGGATTITGAVLALSSSSRAFAPEMYDDPERAGGTWGADVVSRAIGVGAAGNGVTVVTGPVVVSGLGGTLSSA